MMAVTHTALIIATLFCSLTAGFVFAFATVVMPGLRKMEDGDFLRAFQLIDGVIQNKQPLFMLMWVGSIAALLAAVVLGFGSLAGVDRVLLLTAGMVYFGGVQLPTFTVNVPLNNRLKRLDVDALDPKERRSVREAFEPRWNRSNAIRTAFASLSVALMMILLIRL